jgi:hypothetical protein
MKNVVKKQIIEAMVPAFLQKIAEAYEEGWKIAMTEDGQVEDMIHMFPSTIGVTVCRAEKTAVGENVADSSEKSVDSVAEVEHNAEKPKRQRQAQK